MKKQTFIAAMSAVCFSVFVLGTTSAFATEGFRDVEPGRWYCDSIKNVSEKGLIQGYPDGTFRPEQTVTYGEFLAMAIQTTGEEIPSTRKEGEHWAIDYYRHAEKQQYFGDESIGAYQLNDRISRGHMALILSRMLGEEIDVSGEYYTRLQHTIQDVTSRTKLEYHITRVYGAGILCGYPDHTFRPDAFLTRAQAASVLWKLTEPEKRTAPTLQELKRLSPVEDSRMLETWMTKDEEKEERQ